MTDTLLNDAEIADRLSGTDWTREGETIVRSLELEDFAAVIAAVNRVAEVAEALNHHPDILVHGWNQLELTVTDHSAGGLTEADFTLATRLDGLL